MKKNKIVVVGAGVIGSIYAARLWLRGHDVSVMARGQRLSDIRTKGLIIKDAMNGKTQKTGVTAVESLGPDDDYDLVMVTVRNDQVAEILPVIAANHKAGAFLFMVNNPLGYDDWLKAAGVARTIIGFPGAGGVVEGPVVAYTVVSRLLQPTTIGEQDGRKTARIKGLARMLAAAGFPVSICSNMDAWQKSHVAWVTPCAFGIYHALARNTVLAASQDAAGLMVSGIREGFAVLRALRIPITPGKLKALEWLPEAVLTRILMNWAATRHFEVVALRHSLNARAEMESLAAGFMRLRDTAGIETPALDKLYHKP